jgi:hypothetical protein
MKRLLLIFVLFCTLGVGGCVVDPYGNTRYVGPNVEINPVPDVYVTPHYSPRYYYGRGYYRYYR